MTTITDDIGVWNNLGEIQPNITQWLKFPIQSTGANAVFRATFTCADWAKANAYIWVRPRYQTANSNQIGRAIRLYPTEDKQIFQIFIPQDLQDRAVYYRDFEAKKTLRWRRRIGITPSPIIQVKLEELWG